MCSFSPRGGDPLALRATIFFPHNLWRCLEVGSMNKLSFIAIILTIEIEIGECIHSNLCNRPNVTCSEQDLVKIYWNLNGLHQDDPRLIEAIRNDILIPPDSLPVSMSGPLSRKKLVGQFQQVEVVEEMLELRKKRAKKAGFFVEAGAGCGEHLSNR